MRASVKLLAASLLLISSISFARNGERTFRKLINSKIMYPLHLSQKVETEVYVEFTVLENAKPQIKMRAEKTRITQMSMFFILEF